MKGCLAAAGAVAGVLAALYASLWVVALTQRPPAAWRAPTPETFDPRLVAAPAAVERALGPASAGHAWRIRRDWDGSIVEACLVNVTAPGAPIDLAAEEHVDGIVPPRGYRWIGISHEFPGHGSRKVEICLLRSHCRHGQEPGLRLCYPPQ